MVETALPPAVNSPLLHCINQGDRSTILVKKSNKPCGRGHKKMHDSIFPGDLCCMLHRPCVCSCYLQLQGGCVLLENEHTLVARKRWRVRWLQISHWLTARLAAGAGQSQTPAWNHRMASAWGKAASSFCPGDDITMCRPCLPWDRFWERS